MGAGRGGQARNPPPLSQSLGKSSELKKEGNIPKLKGIGS
jgi:hypothetical protein